MKLGKLKWYLCRLSAMDPTEIALRVRKKLYEKTDARCSPASFAPLARFPESSYPELPRREAAPGALLRELQEELPRLRSGQWPFFRELAARVSLPPRWDEDVLAGVCLETSASGFEVDYRHLPQGADIKCIWEPSRWQHLTRIAMAGWLLPDRQAGSLVLSLLEDWVEKNPPFRGWNWTSALEGGIRLLQFCWIDAFLCRAGFAETMERLRGEILPPHVHFVWRHRSFGSSANNHLIGELAGLITALARWSSLAKWCVPLETLRDDLEREILCQFLPDGGNAERAFSYHLFSWELCFHAGAALASAGREFSEAARARLDLAEQFYTALQPEGEAWDFGDSDDAYGLPVFLRDGTARIEWKHWMEGRSEPALDFWLPKERKPRLGASSSWWIFPESGYGVWRDENLLLRLDASPLGLGSIAAHGHCDALHLSVWVQGRPVLIDPGTGAYYGDPELRERLADWEAHNGPRPSRFFLPSRKGPFLWTNHHPRPGLGPAGGDGIDASLAEASGRVARRVVTTENGWRVEDELLSSAPNSVFRVRWLFAPGFTFERSGENDLTARFGSLAIGIRTVPVAGRMRLRTEDAVACSPGFRRVASGPVLELEANAEDNRSALATEFTIIPYSS